MKVFVRIRLSDGRMVDLGPESVIGRMRSAALYLNDPAISEAHALVSLRGSQLKLLALRGRFRADGEPTAEVTLRAGQTIELGPDVSLSVEQVSLPTEVLAVRAHNLPLQILPPVASISASTGELVPGFSPNTEALLWIDGEAVHVRRPGLPDELLVAGAALDVADTTFVIERMSLERAGAGVTRGREVDAPVHLVLRFDTVHVRTSGRVEAIDGIPARILCELAELGGPVEWRTAATGIWPDERDDTLLRRNWDAGLSRLRRAFLEHQIRGDLVRSAGRGRIELFLRPGDTLDDRQ